MVAAGICFLGVYSYYAPTLPHFSTIDDYQPKVGSRIYSADNQLIGEFAAERRVLVPADRIPQRLFNAFIAAEDKRFYSHWGIDTLGVAQAIFDKIRKPGAKLRGASTISQQVAKSLLVTHESYSSATERSFTRKIREAILAWRLERSLSKQEIIYMYVSQIFLGHKAYGVQAAAEHYFRKNVWDMSLAEMATLAGLPQRPSDYSPFSRPEAAKVRRKYVLGRMLIDGYIEQGEYEEAMVEVLKVYPRYELYLQVAPYFTEQVRRMVVDRYGERALLEEGLDIYTTVNLGHQHYAQNAVTKGLKDLDKRQGFRGALANIPEPKRALFKSMYRETLGLEDGKEITFEDRQRYLAMVTSIGPNGKIAKLDVAGREGLLPLAGMRWGRKPNPTQRVDMHYLDNLKRALNPGDVVAVYRTTRAGLSKDKYGWEIVDTVPKEKDSMLFRLDQEPIAQAAALTVDARTGYVLAQVGGYSFEDSTFNRAVQACREPGSAFKPIVYSAAIDKLDYTASTLIDDKPLLFDDPENEVRWKPNNAGMKFRGAIPLRTCLMHSINTPAIRIASAVGIDDIIRNARNLGVVSPLKRELGTALGSSCVTLSELTRAYVALNRYGDRKPLKFIRRVVDRYGNVLEDSAAATDPTLSLANRLDRAYLDLVTPAQRALDKQTAFLTVRLMRNVVEQGTAMGARWLGTIAAKTGTTNDAYDAWFMGFTKDIVAGVWVGHDKKERPLGVSEQGGRTALPIWTDMMARVLTDYTVKPAKRFEPAAFSVPPGVVTAVIDPESGLLARPDTSRGVREWYRAGSEPTEFAPDQEVFNPEQVDIWDADTPL